MKYRNLLIGASAAVGTYAIICSAARKYTEDEGINDGNPYLNLHCMSGDIGADRTVDSYGGEKKDKTAVDIPKGKQSLYVSTVKPVLDKVLSFGGLIILSPLYGIIALAIKIDDSGPVFFTQKRIGKDKIYFMCHKFRTMRMDTPHDVPTHQLADSEQYITKVGGFLRRTSLDELPQIWDIFRGRMSIIGPRPALWNQDDLVAERDKYGVNAVMPGLTGLAQISGRDKLGIPDKAKLDGEYVEKQGFFMDAKCFFKTIVSVVKYDGVVEGGTGNLTLRSSRSIGPVDLADAGFEEYGYRTHFNIDKNAQKKVLITGAGSYIGESFQSYCEGHYPNLSITVLDMKDEKWKSYDFSPFDTVFHVAGIAHADVGKVSEPEQKKYYTVNTALAVETARVAKESGVKQFIFMSSMIIYGGAERIDEITVPKPANIYGNSKWLADKGVRELDDASFHVAVLRPPMIYGKGSKGNYLVLSKWAKRVPFFPSYENKRSMLYVENLCEFVSQLCLSQQGGIYFPQNSEYTKTSTMVNLIGEQVQRPVHITKLLNPAAGLAFHVPGKVKRLAEKAFGSSYYVQELSTYDGLEYQKVGLEESIKRTEGEKETVLILVNHDVVIYNFRLELVERLLTDGYEVHISSPYGERIDDLISIGAIYHKIDINRHGMNPKDEFRIFIHYKKLIKEIKPVIVFGYTIKPNIYGSMAARASHVPFVANITGLGTAVENGGIKQKLSVLLYKTAFGTKHGKVQRVFFQNEENEQFFKDACIALDKHALLPGSGVNLERYPYREYPKCGNGVEGEPVKFAFISRIMKEKGIDQYLDAAEEIRNKFPSAEFHVCGFCELGYDGRLQKEDKKGTVIYHGMIRDVSEFMGSMHCIIHPTYYPEGISNVLLEACASGRPIITTDRSGCREVVDDGANGYIIIGRDSKALVSAIEKFIRLSWEQKKIMGCNSRSKVENEFDRRIVVEKYVQELRKAVKRSRKARTCAGLTVS